MCLCVYKENSDQHPLLGGSLLTLPIDTLITRRIYALPHHICVRQTARTSMVYDPTCGSLPPIRQRGSAVYVRMVVVVCMLKRIHGIPS